MEGIIKVSLAEGLQLASHEFALLLIIRLLLQSGRRWSYLISKFVHKKQQNQAKHSNKSGEK